MTISLICIIVANSFRTETLYLPVVDSLHLNSKTGRAVPVAFSYYLVPVLVGEQKFNFVDLSSFRLSQCLSVHGRVAVVFSCH